jgi:hypothetical protein
LESSSSQSGLAIPNGDLDESVSFNGAADDSLEAETANLDPNVMSPSIEQNALILHP